MADNEATTTTDHDTIRQWVEEREGKPARVRGTEDDGGGTGVLRIEFQDPGDDLEVIDWDEWFATFDESDLAFLHQSETKDGSTSRFFKLVSR